MKTDMENIKMESQKRLESVVDHLVLELEETRRKYSLIVEKQLDALIEIKEDMQSEK